MAQKGTHTWELVIHQHRCPDCGFFFESRKNYTYRLGQYLKDLTCPRCEHDFTVEKKRKPTFGPFWDQDIHLFD